MFLDNRKPFCEISDPGGSGQGATVQPETTPEVPTEYMGADLSGFEDSVTRQKVIDAIKIKDGKVGQAMTTVGQLRKVAQANGLTVDQMVSAFPELLRSYQAGQQPVQQTQPDANSELLDTFTEELIDAGFDEGTARAKAQKRLTVLEKTISAQADARVRPFVEQTRAQNAVTIEKAARSEVDALAKHIERCGLDKEDVFAEVRKVGIQAGRMPDKRMVSMAILALKEGGLDEIEALYKPAIIEEYTTKKKTDTEQVGLGLPRDSTIPAAINAMKGKTLQERLRAVVDMQEAAKKT